MSASGLFCALELKAPGKKATKLQQLTLNKIAKSGGAVRTIDSWDTFCLFMSECVDMPVGADPVKRAKS
jgi:hypothetical protein